VDRRASLPAVGHCHRTGEWPVRLHDRRARGNFQAIADCRGKLESVPVCMNISAGRWTELVLARALPMSYLRAILRRGTRRRVAGCFPQ
jgi:hypothetical protein